MQIVIKQIERFQNLRFIGGKNIPPHNRAAGSNAGKVAEATGSVIKNFFVFVRIGQRIHQ